MLSSFPLCIKGWLKILDVNSNDELQSDDWKSSSNIPPNNWQSKFCLLMENDSRLYIFNDEPNANELPIPPHMVQFRIDTELNAHSFGESSSCIDDVSTISSKNHDGDRYASNSSLSHLNGSKQYSRSGFFRSGSRFFRRAKSNSKLSANTDPSQKDIANFEMTQTTKSVSNLKRSLSLSRLNRKKSEEKADSKSPQTKLKANLMTQSTGDLTMNVPSSIIMWHNLARDAIISEVHTSLVCERPHCFSVKSYEEELNIRPSFDGKSGSPAYTTKYFAARSHLEKQCWMKRLQQTLKPNMENENRLNNSMKLTIFETKCLPSVKRRYYCEVSLDKNLYARTTSKQSSNDGSVFWAEELVLNNLPTFKILVISLFKEQEPGKDSKKKKKKHQNQCIGLLSFNLSTLNSKSEIQSWFNLKSSDILPDLGNVQLRVKLKYQSLKVLKAEAYHRLHEIVTENYLELIQFLEKNLPVKLKEEIAICLVNIHEKNGTIIKFVSDLITEEINDLDNSAMTLRANTIVTKIIESHMKLVGSQYLYNMLYPLIHAVMFKDVTIEVDPSRFDSEVDHKDKHLLDNQHILTDNLKRIWNKIYDSQNRDFPKQLRSVFVGWRNNLTSTASVNTDQEKVASHCDMIVSGCLFLRLLCPAILSPHLFGLVSHFSDKTAVLRTLTLIAKSLQSLANFSKFGEKEHFMIFLNSCFDEEIPRMHDFLRAISSPGCLDESEDENEAVLKEIHYYGVTIDLPLEMARLYNCLISDGVKEHISNSPKFQNVIKLPEIIHQITQQLITSHISHSSFFSLKRNQGTVVLPMEQRRTSITQSMNPKTFDFGRLDKDITPPLLGSPVCQSSLVDPVSEYASHNDDVWQRRSDVNLIPCRSTKPNASIVYSTKPQYGMNPIPKNQFNSPAIKKGHYNTYENEVDQQSPRVNELKLMSSSSNSRDSQLKSSIPKYVQPSKVKTPIKTVQAPQKKSGSKVPPDNYTNKGNESDLFKPQTLKKNYSKLIDYCDNDFYRENPIYDYVNLPIDTHSDGGNSIDRYFIVRTQLNLLEQKRRQGNNECGDNQDEDYLNLCQQLKEIRRQVQSGQVNDLKQLENILKSYKSVGATKAHLPLNSAPRSNSSQSQKSTQSHIIPTDVLDDVINSITSDGAGLDEAQQNLRKHMKKSSKTKQPVAPASRRQMVSMEPVAIATARHSVETAIHAVAIDISESNQSDVTDSSSNRVHSHSSSNCSSLMSGLI